MDVAVIGGGFAGLSAAEVGSREGHDVALYEKSSFENGEELVRSWGGGVTDYSRVPRSKEVKGYVRDLDKVLLREDNQDEIEFDLSDGAMVERPVFDAAWGRDLRSRADVRENFEVSESDFWRICSDNDLVIDATGGRPLSIETQHTVHSSDVAAKVFSTVTEGDFSDIYPHAMVAPHGSGYEGINPISEDRAMMMVGSYRRQSDADMPRYLASFCSDWGADLDSSDLEVKNVPIIGGLELQNTKYTTEGATVKLVGDAASLGDRMTGTDLSRAAHSAMLAVQTESTCREYPEALSEEVYNGWLHQEISNHLDIGQELSMADALAQSNNVSYEKLFRPTSNKEMGREMLRLITGR
jgi:flavin-dependent dehydrogenase